MIEGSAQSSQDAEHETHGRSNLSTCAVCIAECWCGRIDACCHVCVALRLLFESSGYSKSSSNAIIRSSALRQQSNLHIPPLIVPSPCPSVVVPTEENRTTTTTNRLADGADPRTLVEKRYYRLSTGYNNELRVLEEKVRNE